MSKHIFTTFFAICAGALLFAACGDSEPTLTKAEFVKQADAICRKGETKKAEGFEKFVLKAKAGPGNPLTIAQQGELATDVMLPPIREMVEGIDDLKGPEGEEEEADAIVDEVESVVGDLEDNPLPLATAKGDPFDKAAKLSEDFGFKQCFIYYSSPD